jgi:hypothetical protein
VQHSHGYNTNVAAIKAEAIGFRTSPIAKKASIHVNSKWQRYGSSGEYMRKADMEEEVSFEDLLSEMKAEEGGAPPPPRGLDDNEGQISDPFISFGPQQWWWLSPEQLAAETTKTKRLVAERDKLAIEARSSAGEDSLALATSTKRSTAEEHVFEAAVQQEMATISNTKLSGCPCTLLRGEKYSCRRCTVGDAICKTMVLTDGAQTDHPFCYACLDEAHTALSEMVGSAIKYVQLDTVNYGVGFRGLPDRQLMSLDEAKARFRVKDAERLRAAGSATSDAVADYCSVQFFLQRAGLVGHAAGLAEEGYADARELAEAPDEDLREAGERPLPHTHTHQSSRDHYTILARPACGG